MQQKLTQVKNMQTLLLFIFITVSVSSTKAFPISHVTLLTPKHNTLHEKDGPRDTSSLIKNSIKDEDPLVNNKKEHKYRNFRSSISRQYQQRMAADPAFLSKSILEVGIATSSQLLAEVNRRGFDRILPEIDFVFAATLTAIVGKYYSMWRVAPTLESQVVLNKSKDEVTASTFIPNNAFQSSSSTLPTIQFHHRICAFLLPMPSLFQAGFLASLFGYGITSFLIQMRNFFFPSFISQTYPVNIWEASAFTGVFVALISNLRYQMLQGIIEPRIINRLFREYVLIKRSMIFLVRYANGLLGSSLAIMGMRWLGLQKVK